MQLQKDTDYKGCSMCIYGVWDVMCVMTVMTCVCEPRLV